MGLNLFGKKKPKGSALPPVQPRGIPRAPPELVKKVSELSSKGMSEPEIMRSLKDEGYSTLDIDRAIRDSLRSGVGSALFPVKERSASELPQRREYPEVREDLALPDEYLRKPLKQTQPPSMTRQVRPTSAGIGGKADIEELIEVTVAEKLEEVDKKLLDLEDRIKETENKMRGLDSSMNQVRSGKDSQLVELRNKVEESKDTINQIEAKVEGIESVLKDSLTTLRETMRSLQDTMGSKKK